MSKPWHGSSGRQPGPKGPVTCWFFLCPWESYIIPTLISKHLHEIGRRGLSFSVRMMKSTRWVALWGPVLGAWACLPPPVDFLENKTLPYTAAPEALKTGVDSVDLFAEQCDMAKEVENAPLRCSSPFASENVSFVFYGLRHLEYLSEAEAHVTENQNPL